MKYVEQMEVGWSTTFQPWAHNVPILDTILLLSFLKMPVVHSEMEQRRFPFLVIPFPVFSLPQ